MKNLSACHEETFNFLMAEKSQKAMLVKWGEGDQQG